MTKTFLGVRDVDKEILIKFKAKAIENRLKIGEALTQLMEKFLEEKEMEKKPNPKNLLKIKPIKIGSKKVKWSEEIDDILYG